MRAPELLMIFTAYNVLGYPDLGDVIKLLDSKRLNCSAKSDSINKNCRKIGGKENE